MNAFPNCSTNLFLIGALLSFALILSAHATIEMVIDGNWSGSQTQEAKMAYVMGAMDHATMANPDVAAKLRRDVKGTCAALDRFYEAPGNRQRSRDKRAANGGFPNALAAITKHRFKSHERQTGFIGGAVHGSKRVERDGNHWARTHSFEDS